MSGPAPFAQGWSRALVVFSGRTDLPWLRLLKPGFRHCFVVLGCNAGWLCVNPMAHGTSLTILPVAGDFDLEGWYCNQGLRTLMTWPGQPLRHPLPWRPYTCVEEVKRVLGLSECTALTPWQLYLYLQKYRIFSLTPPGEPARVSPSTPDPCPLSGSFADRPSPAGVENVS